MKRRNNFMFVKLFKHVFPLKKCRKPLDWLRLILFFCILSMTTQRKVLKWFIIMILAVFLLSTGLVSVMYLANNGTTTDQLSWADSLPWTETPVVETAPVETGATLPTMTKEEAARQLQQLLSWVKAPPK